MKAEKIREKFKTAAGRKAFDRLNKLGAPRWTFQKQHDGVYLSPSIEILVRQDDFLHSPSSGYGKTVDEVAIEFEKELKEMASVPNVAVVTNAYHGKRSEFTYNSDTKRFRKIFP